MNTSTNKEFITIRTLRLTICTLIFTLVFILGSFFVVRAGSEDFKLKTSDNEVEIEVTRSFAQQVKVTLHLAHPTEYSHVVIERCGNESNQFSQCGYIDLKEETGNDGVVSKKDNYPSRPSIASYYRVKMVTVDGAERTYPPVRLPAIQ